MRYSEESAPEEQDWITYPGHRLTRRLYEQSRIHKNILEGKPSWTEAKSDIVPFFNDLDVLFLYDRENQKEWFERVVLNDAPKPPVCIDLLEMHRFFCPDRDLPDRKNLPEPNLSDDEALIRQFVSQAEINRSAPRLPFLVRSLGGVLQDIVSRIRSESEAKEGKHLVYTLLGRALNTGEAAKPPSAFRDFEALFRVAGMAHRIQWNKNSLFAKPYGSEAPQIIRDADFPKDPDIEDDARKQKNWLIQEWSKLLAEEAKQGYEAVSRRKPFDPKNPPRVARPVVNSERVDEAFNWLVKKENFQPRKEQQEYARFFTKAINDGGSYAIEAGTGTGKTLGYLIPASECIRQSQAMAAEDMEDGEEVEAGKVIIATATKNLQDHLLDKEWRRLAQTGSLYQNLKAAPLKGKNNFLCITAVADIFGETYIPRTRRNQKRTEKTSSDDEAQKRLAWLFLFLVLIHNRGETESIPRRFFRSRLPDLEDFLSETKADIACTPGLCRMGASCIYPRHLQEAQRADIVVTNHYKLPLMDSQIQALGHTCLIDEADQFPDNLRNAATIEFSSYDIRRHFLQRIQGSANRRGFAEILEDRFLKMQDSSKKNINKEDIDNALDHIRSILASCEAIEHCSNTIGNVLKNSGKFRNNKNDEKRWIEFGGDIERKLQNNLSDLAEHCKKIAICWNDLSEIKIYEKIENLQQKQDKNRIIKYMRYANDLANNANEMQHDYPSSSYVHVCSCKYSKYSDWKLKKIPYDISKIVQTTCCDPYPTTIFTSATLFVDEKLDLFSTELGISFTGDMRRRISSPFAYEKQVQGFVTTSVSVVPNFKDGYEKHRQWREEAAHAIARLAVAMNGRTLVLFTNTKEMGDIFEQVKSTFEKYGIEPLLQDGISLTEIDTFAAIEESVLFGVNRFWTGVDFPDRTLSQVLVVRSPNPNLSDPIIKHRQEIMEEDFWKNYYRPASKLRLRQGFGRLIRKESDKGLFVVLDQRIWSKEYMRDMQNAVPIPLQRRSTEPDEMDWFINEGLTHLGLKAEFEGRNIDLRNIKIPGKPRPAQRRPGQRR